MLACSKGSFSSPLLPASLLLNHMVYSLPLLLHYRMHPAPPFARNLYGRRLRARETHRI